MGKSNRTKVRHIEGLDGNEGHYAKWWNKRVGYNIIVVGLSWAMYAFDYTALTPMLSLPHLIFKFQGYDGGPEAPKFTAINFNLIISVPLVGAALGGFLSKAIQQRLGRKKSILAAYGLCCIPSTLLQLFAPSLVAFVVGRFWNNLGISVANVASGLYLSEMCPAYLRARTVGIAVAASDAISILAATAVWASQKFDDPRQYQIPLAIQAAIPVVLFFLTLPVVESPTWLALWRGSGAARQAIMKLHPHDIHAVETEVDALSTLVSAVQNSTSEGRVHYTEILKKRNIRRTLLAGAYASLSQVCGQILVLQFGTVVLVERGVGDAFQSTVIIFVAQFAGVLVGMSLVDTVGRRPVGLCGFGLLTLLNFGIGAIGATWLGASQQWVALAAFFIVFAFFNALVFQSLLLLLPAELPSARLREATAAWALTWSYITAITTSFVTPHLLERLGVMVHFIFGGFALLSFGGTFFYLPETKGRTLAEIEQMFSARVPARRWSETVETNRP